MHSTINFGVFHFLKEKKYKRFLDFQNDVAVTDVELALREGIQINRAC